MTRCELLAAVPGAQPHHVAALMHAGRLRPEPTLDASHRRHYVPAHVSQLEAYVAGLEAKRARQDARRALRGEAVSRAS